MADSVATMREFHTKPKPPKPPIPFSIDGREFSFTPPGWAPIMLANSESPMDVTRTYLDWLGAGLPDEDGQFILDRLLDPKDDFDLEDITEVILGVVQEATGRPIEPPTDSLPQQALNGSTDGRQAKESTPPILTPAGS